MADTNPTTTTSSYTPVLLSTFPSNPLTTTFVPPSSSCSGIYWSVVGMIDEDTECLPTGFSTAATAFFSPGIACPSGYVSACHDTSGFASITTVTCCPTRGDVTLSCVDPATLENVWETLFCSWIAPASGQVVSMTMSDSGTTSTVATTLTSPEGLNAFGVRMVHQSTDLSTSTSSSSATARSTTTGSAANTSGAGASQTATPDSSSSSGGGLSTGAKAAIGVVVPLVVLGALAALFFFWWRRRRQSYSGVHEMGGTPVVAGSKEQYNSSSYQGGAGPGGGGGAAQYGGYYDPHKPPHNAAPSELSSTTGWGGGRSPDGGAPVTATPHQIAELSNSAPPAELPAEPRRR